jgi:acylphosphatase
MKTVRLRGSGRVQGVGFRLWAVETATSFGLRGWVRNRSDGTIEILMTGAEDAVAAMVEASRQGPRAARVVAIEIAEGEDDGSAGFTTRPTK